MTGIPLVRFQEESLLDYFELPRSPAPQIVGVWARGDYSIRALGLCADYVASDFEAANSKSWWGEDDRTDVSEDTFGADHFNEFQTAVVFPGDWWPSQISSENILLYSKTARRSYAAFRVANAKVRLLIVEKVTDENAIPDDIIGLFNDAGLKPKGRLERVSYYYRIGPSLLTKEQLPTPLTDQDRKID